MNSNSVEIEIQLAVTITCHSAILMIDHLGDVLVKHGEGTKLKALRLHRTKCSKIISKVVAPSMQNELRQQLQGQKYALLVDEATDLASSKHFCIAIRFLNEAQAKVETRFLDLVRSLHFHIKFLL